MADDPYRVLGVAPDASDGEIKRAYRKLARQYHPDRNPGDAAAEERFKAIQAAYEQVESPQKRREYDEQQRMQSMFGGGDPGNFEFNFEGGAPGGIEDIIASFFGARGSRAPPGSGGGGVIFDQHGRVKAGSSQPSGRSAGSGKVIEAPLDLTLEEALAGGDKQFSISRLRRCKDCHGGGCGACDGNGVSRRTSKVTVNVPAGAEHSSVMRLKGLGHEHPQGPPGDLLLTVRIDADEGRRWEDGRIVQTVEISYSTMLLGGEVSLRTPTGKLVEVKVPAETQSGDRQRLKGEGYGGGHLDIEFELQASEQLTAEQRALLKQLRDSGL